MQEMTGRLSMANLSAMVASLRGSLDLTAAALCEAHGWRSGPWFDDLRAACIRDAKSHIVEGMPIGEEVEALEQGVRIIDFLFESYAAKLLPPDTASR